MWVTPKFGSKYLTERKNISPTRQHSITTKIDSQITQQQIPMPLLRLVALTTLGLATLVQPTIRYNNSHNNATCTRAAVASICVAACYLQSIIADCITAPPALAQPSLQLTWLLRLISPNLGCATMLEHTHSRCFNLRGRLNLHSRHFNIALTKLEVSR